MLQHLLPSTRHGIHPVQQRHEKIVHDVQLTPDERAERVEQGVNFFVPSQREKIEEAEQAIDPEQSVDVPVHQRQVEIENVVQCTPQERDVAKQFVDTLAPCFHGAIALAVSCSYSKLSNTALVAFPLLWLDSVLEPSCSETMFDDLCCGRLSVQRQTVTFAWHQTAFVGSATWVQARWTGRRQRTTRSKPHWFVVPIRSEGGLTSAGR